MLAMFQVRDLPREPAVRVAETTPLAEVDRLLGSQPVAAVIVVASCGAARGVVPVSQVRQMARVAPEMLVGTFATSTLVGVEPSMALVDAVRAMSPPGVGALLVEDGEGTIITRDALLAFDSWAPLLEARSARLAKALDEQDAA